MNKNTIYLGIDISKAVFDVFVSSGEFYQFENNKAGFKKFFKLLSKDCHCVMEATGYYHQQFAYYLYERGIAVSVENPLSVKRFGQMKLSKVKTDKADAKLICMYAQNVDLKLWQGESKNLRECFQIIRLIDSYFKQSTALKNKIHGEKTLGNPSSYVVRSLKRSLKSLQKEIKQLEDKLTQLVKQDHQELLTKIETIPGIGRRTASMLIVLTGGFTRFDSASQLCSFAGITPIIRESGSSIRGKARISKMGNQKLRNLLFLCSFTACQHNKACREIYERITAKGKPKKLALMAVCNKLLKQAFAIAESGLVYDENFRSKKPMLD
jgi:transposase